MKNKDLIPSVNFHLTKACNMKCNYCFAGFKNVYTGLAFDTQKNIVFELKEKGFEKINFVGGEPLLNKTMPELIIYAKNLGFYTSIVTNASFINNDFLCKVQDSIDMIGISIDSLKSDTNKAIGRFTQNNIPDANYYFNLCKKISSYNIDLKVNTVVSRYNLHEDFNNFIFEIKPERWKVFQVLEVNGENNIDDAKITESEFHDFIKRHLKAKQYLIEENNDTMRSSYIMIDPQGCFYDNTKGGYTVSTPINKIGIDKALNQIHFDFDKFIKREGDYYKDMSLKTSLNG